MLIAVMCDDIWKLNFTTNPLFENANCTFYCGLIPKAAKMKTIPLCKQHINSRGLRSFWL